MATKSKKSDTPAPSFLKIQRVHNAFGLFQCFEQNAEPVMLGTPHTTRRTAKKAAAEHDGPTEITRLGTQYIVFSVEPVQLPSLVRMCDSRKSARAAAVEFSESNPGVTLRKRSTGDDD